MDVSKGTPVGCCVLKCLFLGCNLLEIFAEEESQLLVLVGGSLFIWVLERENSFIKRNLIAECSSGRDAVCFCTALVRKQYSCSGATC